MIKEIQNGKNIMESIENLKAEKTQLSDFLIDEIFIDFSIQLQKGLMLASLFDRFSLNLIESVSVSDVKQAERENIQIRNAVERFFNKSMFIIPLDQDQEWYRFHHLVQNYLRSRIRKSLEKEQIDRIHLLGSDYFASMGFMEEAIDHAIKGNSLTMASQIIADHYDELVALGEHL